MGQPRTLRRLKAQIDGDRVVLRTLTPRDASGEYAGWLNDPSVNQYLETRSINLEELKRYIQEKDESDCAILFGIFWKADARHIGNVKLEPVDFAEGVATMGILIGDKEYWGKGVGTEVTNLITDYAFNVLGLTEVHLGVMSTNVAAIRVYEKCGYVIESVEEKSINHDGVLYDRVRMKKTAASSVCS